MTSNNPACWCCWPTFTPAVVYDKNGIPCCTACISKPDHKPNVPSFMTRYVWDVSEVMLEDAA